MDIARTVSRILDRVYRLSKRFDPWYRDSFDDLFKAPLVRFVQYAINLPRKDEHLAIAEERPLPEEEEPAREVTEQMSAFLVKHYEKTGRTAERAGNTKTYGLVKATFQVLPDLEEGLRMGLFRDAKSYPAWVRFGGPGPLVTPDIENNGILSIGVKVMEVPGEKLIEDERRTQDFLGISCPTFTTPNVRENLKLQKNIYNDTGVWYFVNPRDSHLRDMLMQGLYARSYANPLELGYYSCVPYLYGAGRAVKYAIRPVSDRRSRVPKHPSPDYLREAMVATLDKQDVEFDFCIQFQTDPHRMPIEDASVMWLEKFSPFIRVARLCIPEQEFASPEQLSFARNLSFNPWHALPEHRPLGNQNRARRRIYMETSKLRRKINAEDHIEPTGEEFEKLR